MIVPQSVGHLSPTNSLHLSYFKETFTLKLASPKLGIINIIIVGVYSHLLEFRDRMVYSLSRKCVRLQNINRMLKMGIHSVNELDIDR